MAGNPPTPQWFVPRKDDQEQIDPLDYRINLLHMQDRYNVHTHGGGGLRFATKVVAAHDSLDHASADYDYLCTGSSDQATINAAFSAASATGGEVLLMEGNYNLTGSILPLSGTSFRGLNFANTYLNIPAGATYPAIKVDSKSNVKISDLAIDISAATSNAADCIDLLTCSDIIIQNVLVYGNFSSGSGGDFVFTTTSNYVQILGCQSFDTGGLVLTGSQFVAANNVFVGTTGVRFYSATESVAVGNVVLFESGATFVYGFSVEATNGDCAITGNMVKGAATGIGIYLSTTAKHNTVSGNTIEACLIGIQVQKDENVISGNMIDTPQHEGIYVDHGATDNLVCDNYVLGAGAAANNTYDGILVHATGGSATNDNYLHGNKVRKGGGGNQARYGINVDQANANTNLIVNNDLKNSFVTAAFNDAGTGTVKNLDGSANNWNRLA